MSRGSLARVKRRLHKREVEKKIAMAEKPSVSTPTVHYTQVVQVVAVTCANCQNTATPNVARYALDLAQVPMIAAEIHASIIKQTKALCVSPRLTISTMNVFVDSRLFTEQAEKSKIVEP